MSIELYHQVGFRDRWNIDSLVQDGCGAGMILSPVHQSQEQVQNLPAHIKQHSLFDPQYYLPTSTKAKLTSYPFFPGALTGGFTTTDFELVALESAVQCVDFQIEQGFSAVVIPARFFDQMVSTYFEKQERSTVVPFLSAIEKAKVDKPVYMTLPLTSAMLLDSQFRTQLLNWVTGFPQFSGIYVLIADDRASKQIRSADLIFSYLSFAHALSNAGLRPVLGHLNTESVLFSLIEGAALTFGSYENTRIFSIDKFIESDEERRSPKARIYLPALLNWIQFDQAMQIRQDDPDLWAAIYSPTLHADHVIATNPEPHFTQPGLYRHHFECMNAQINNLAAPSVPKRFESIRSAIKSAMELNARIEEMPLDLDPHGRGEHLQPWLDGLNRFYRKFLKE